MGVRMALQVLIVLGAILLPLPLFSAPAATVTVYPLVSFEPSNIRVRVQIEPHKDNRAACIEYDSPTGMYSKSCWELDAQYERKTFYLAFPGLSGGKYITRFVVFGAGWKALHTSNEVSFVVVPRNGEAL
jgi:hypothetical protein